MAKPRRVHLRQRLAQHLGQVQHHTNHRHSQSNINRLHRQAIKAAVVAKAVAIAAEAMVVETAVEIRAAARAAKGKFIPHLDIHKGNGESCCLFLLVYVFMEIMPQ